MSIKLEMMRVFRVVAEQGTLAASARQLGRTPSALSMSLAQLEQSIGAPLFETDRKSRLTPLGQLVFEECCRATDAFDQSAAAIARHAVSKAGTVRIVAVPSATVSVLPAVIAEFGATRPDVRIEISDVDSSAVRRRVQRGDADIGILSARPGDAPSGVLIQRDDLGIACAEGGPVHRAQQESGARPSWDLLDREPLIANPLCDLVDHTTIRAALLHSTLQARNTTAILSFVRRGLGVSVLPHDAVKSQPEGVEFFVPSDPLCQRELRAILQPGAYFGPAADAFWNLLAGPE